MTEILNHRKLEDSIPWVLAGDFNTPLYPSEKIGGNPIDLQSAEDLQSLFTLAELMEVEMSGCKFTWSNRRYGKDLIMSKLDRVMISEEWMNKELSLKALPKIGSDHNPLLLNVAQGKTKKIPFRFENMWLQHKDFHENLKD